MISKRYMLFAVLIAASIVLIVPMANAENIPNVSSAKTASAFPLPKLYFNDSQEKIVVIGELSPGMSIRTINGSFTSTTVPFGTIVYHANNVTRVFDNNGQQLLISDDNKVGTIHTFKGDSLATFIHEVPNNSVIVDDGNKLHVVYNDTRILTIIDDSKILSNPKSYVSVVSTACGGSPYPSQYIEGVESPVISSPGQFSADWNVPSSPIQWKQYPIATPIAIWNGLFGCVEGDPKTSLLQPVLEWFYYDAYMSSYPTSPEWTMSTWYLWGNGQTILINGTPVTYIHSSRITGIYPGIPIRGFIQINANGYDAIGTIMDNRPEYGGSSTLYLTQNTAPERMPTQNLIATIVLEGWDVDHRNKHLSSEYLPGPVTFKNFVLTDHDDNNLIPTTSMTSFVNSPYWDQNNFTDSGNLTVYNRWPTDITLVNNPDRVNPPVTNFNALVTSGHGTTSVPFRDLSTGSPFLWLWNFGDGSSSTDQNPTHTYSLPGSFTVNLTVWNAGGVNSLVRPNYIIIVFVPVPRFVVNADHGTAPLTIQFNDTSINSPTSWNWSFGDGNYSTARNATHTYSQAGTYNVSLYAANAAGGNTSTQKNINVIPVLKDNVGVFRNSTSSWYLNYDKNSSVNKTFSFGTAGDIPVVGDWNGDGYSDVGYFRKSTGNWSLDTYNNGTADYSFHFGTTGDVPVIGDWNGDGYSDVGVFRPSVGNWYLNYDKKGSVNKTFSFGTTGDIPVVGDWNGDGYSDVGYFRNSTGNWSLDTYNNGTADYSFHFGTTGDVPVIGDWNGDGYSDVGVFRPSVGNWYLDTYNNGTSDYLFHFGTTGDLPVIGDWNGDGYSDVGVFRPSVGNWYLDTYNNGTSDYSFHFGGVVDTPIIGKWI